MKKKLTILCQIISLIYVAICLMILFKTQDRANAEYARVKKSNTDMISVPVERVHSGAVRMLCN
jgi:hypothetical protein